MYLTKSKPRSISILTFSTLMTLLLSVILFGDTAHAQSSTEQIKIDLLNRKPVLEERVTLVEVKSTELQKESDAIREVEQKKESLSDELGDLKKQLAEMKRKIAEKKARERAAAETVQQVAVETTAQPAQVSVAPVVRSGAVHPGNLYAPGNCTWYAKSRRADLPNNLGNANMWYSNAAAAGFAVGSTPRPGAIATTTAGWGGHVAYVESVNGDMVTISEMNYGGLYNMNTRTVHYSEFLYIY